MKKSALTAAALLFAACGESDHDHGHDHDVEHAAGHDDGAGQDADEGHAKGHAKGHDADGGHEKHEGGDADAGHGAAAGPVTVALGAGQATLTPAAKALRLTLTDATGAPVAPSGKARIVLTGTGAPPQRVVLEPVEGGWTGPADAASAPGYVAVISLEIDGRVETARATWGDVPEAAPAPDAPADDAAEEDGGHGHGHGHGH